MTGDSLRAGARRAISLLVLFVSAAVGPSEARAQASVTPEHETMMTWTPTLFVLLDELEYSPSGRERPFSADLLSWYGGSRNRLWLLAEVEQATRGEREGEAEAQLMYGRLIDPFFDAVAGVRYERSWSGAGDRRVFLAVGLIGLAPYRFEFAPTLFISSEGKISARLETGYQFLVTQRLVLEPEIELNASLQDVPDAGLERGLNDYEMQVRLRYELRREFAPYIGWSWSRRYGGGEIPGSRERLFLLGLRLWR
jgi:copper resistance protein B